MNLDDIPVRILHLEDSTLDADLIAEHLRLGAIAYKSDRVWTKEAFEERLATGTYDLILADYTLPTFDGMSALEIARTKRPDIPFIFVSATLGEEIAIEALKKGATDYVVKSRLKRLASCVERALGEARDKAARRHAEAETAEGKARLSAALAIAELGTFEWNLRTGRLTLDERSREIFGLAPGEGARLRDLFEHVAGADIARVAALARGSVSGHARLDMDFAVHRGDGTVRIVKSISDVALDAKGRTERVLGVFGDITEKRAQEERQALLMRELHHRVKNSLATVQSIINFTLNSATDMRDFRIGITNRIGSLARSHTLLNENEWGGVDLKDIICMELEPYDERDRLALTGPRFHLPADVALAFAMAIHEMTTNAVKYGALSRQNGRLRVDWDVRRVGDGFVLRLDWTERDGPPVAPPRRRGFGSTLIERVLAGQLGGDVTVDYAERGVHIAIEARIGRASPGDADSRRLETA